MLVCPMPDVHPIPWILLCGAASTDGPLVVGATVACSVVKFHALRVQVKVFAAAATCVYGVVLPDGLLGRLGRFLFSV